MSQLSCGRTPTRPHSFVNSTLQCILILQSVTLIEGLQEDGPPHTRGYIEYVLRLLIVTAVYSEPLAAIIVATFFLQATRQPIYGQHVAAKGIITLISTIACILIRNTLGRRMLVALASLGLQAWSAFGVHYNVAPEVGRRLDQ